jgi:pentatricopeptide repeat protein
MEDNNNEKKLGDALEELNESIKNKDIEKAFQVFKEIKQNKYSIQIGQKDKFDKEAYNNINISINEKGDEI